ncbi:MAG: dipeptide epimerase [Oscillospiraceae bacterium]|jgi:o-succinylbenzoate synthase|nr:dipeptide epimerase [Oscillospiraceae bacterium]
MIIKSVTTREISVPLVRPFKTALRTVTSAESVIVRIETDDGLVGLGEATPTAVITGDTKGSILCAINDFLAPTIVGRDLFEFDGVLRDMNKAIYRNTSAKAAVDMALYDIYSQALGLPLYKLLGGAKKTIETDMTISLNDTKTMVADSLAAVGDGYRILKIKVGKGGAGDADAVREIRRAVGADIVLRVDANQGWSVRDAIRAIGAMEDAGLDIELVEQPVAARDLAGLKAVTASVRTDILADEAVFTPEDAVTIIRERAADLINIKLMKTGGIYNALRICAIAESFDVKCMMGCMLETKLAVSAAAHLACGRGIITMADLDGPGMATFDPYTGGPVFNGADIFMPEANGIGISL